MRIIHVSLGSATKGIELDEHSAPFVIDNKISGCVYGTCMVICWMFTKQQTCMRCFILSRTVLNAVWTAHTCLLLITSNKKVTYPIQASIRPYIPGSCCPVLDM